MEAASLLADPGATPEAIETALEGVVRNNDKDAFAKAFGPRRLLTLLSKGVLTERAAELADDLLAIPSHSTGVGLSGGIDFGEVLHHDELFPDELISLTSSAVGDGDSSGSLVDSSLRLHRELDSGYRVAFAPSACRALYFDGQGDLREVDELLEEEAEQAPVLRLHSLSRRSRIGSEIECKVWPSAAILGRWLWNNRPIVRGASIWELGGGVGTAGLAAAACGAASVLITDINHTALKCAKANCERNGERVRLAARVSHLDWARPPLLEKTLDAGAGTAAAEGQTEVDAEATALLLQQFDVIIAADVVNNHGLSELVYRMIELYLAPKGLFLMVCPRPTHRHTVEKIRRMLLESASLSARVAEVPAGLLDGLGEEARLLEHELIVAQWADGKRPADVAV